MKVNITVQSLTGKPTIYTALRAKLGREPTHAELCADVRRILADSTIDMAARGKLPHQRKRFSVADRA